MKNVIVINIITSILNIGTAILIHTYRKKISFEYFFTM